MSVPPVPPPLEELGQRPFSFYPAIVGIEHNEWIYTKATWSEILVRNRKSNTEVYIPRVYVGELSRIEEPVAIVGLNKELEYKAGTIVPHVRRVIQMPRAVNDGPRTVNSASSEPAASPRPAPVVGIRLENKTESRVGRMLLVATAVAVIIVVAAVALFQASSRRITFAPVMQSEYQFTASDDFYTITRKLGKPAEDRYRNATGELQYRRLVYPQLGLSVILMGADRDHLRYLGQVDNDGRVIHSANSNAEAMLKQLGKF